MVVTPPAKIVAGNIRIEDLSRSAVRNCSRNHSSHCPRCQPTCGARLLRSPFARFAIAVPDHLRVGYIAAENDAIPDSLLRLGVEVEMLDANALAFGDLSRFDAIVLGLRAYELRLDVVASNHRLLRLRGGWRHARRAGSAASDLGRAQAAPFPATMGTTAPRITDENRR